MNRLLLLCSFFLAAEMLCYSTTILSVSPATQSVTLGSTVSLDIDISGLGNGTALGTYDIDLGFDPTLLSYSSIVFGTQVDISGLGDIQSVTPGTGNVEVFELSLDSPSDLISLQAPSFTLATLTFDTLATGTDSPLTLSVYALGDAYGSSLSAYLEDGSVTIDAPTVLAPEPSTTFSVIGGLFLIGAARLRFPRSSAA